MKFLLDENVEYRIASFLKKQGHDVTAIAHEYPNALTDRQVLAIAEEEERILITNDRTDFRKLVFEHQLPHSGVIVLHLDVDDIAVKQQRLVEAITLYKDRLSHHYLVIMPIGAILQSTENKSAYHLNKSGKEKQWAGGMERGMRHRKNQQASASVLAGREPFSLKAKWQGSGGCNPGGTQVKRGSTFLNEGSQTG